MNPVEPQNSKWAEIRKHGLFGRQLEPMFHSKMGKLLALALGVTLLGITLYWMFTYSGPYRYLAELQLKWLGSYSPELTAVLVLSGPLLGLPIIAVAIKLLFQGAERPVRGMPTASTTTPPAATLVTANASAVVDKLTQRWRRYIRNAVPLVLFGIGAYFYYNGTHAGSLQQLSAADFQSGKLQSNIVYADVRGHLSGRYISKDYYLYIPMASEENAASPVQLLVGVQEHETRKYLHREADGTFTVRGVADKELRLEGDVKYAFEKNGIALGDPVWVVHAGREPSWDKQMGLITMSLGIALAGFVFGWQSYRKRENVAARPMPASD